MESEQQHPASIEAISSDPHRHLEGLSVDSLISTSHRASVPSWPSSGSGLQRGSSAEGPIQRDVHSEGEVSDGGECSAKSTNYKIRSSSYMGLNASTRHRNLWQARTFVEGRATHLGNYRREVDAAMVYDRVVLALQGPKAITNFEADRYCPQDIQRLRSMDRLALQCDLGIKPMNKSSRFRGVSKKNNKWEAKIMVNRKWAWRAVFESEEEAARAYDAAVWRLKPRDAKSYINFPVGGQPPQDSHPSLTQQQQQQQQQQQRQEEVDCSLKEEYMDEAATGVSAESIACSIVAEQPDEERSQLQVSEQAGPEEAQSKTCIRPPTAPCLLPRQRQNSNSLRWKVPIGSRKVRSGRQIGVGWSLPDIDQDHLSGSVGDGQGVHQLSVPVECSAERQLHRPPLVLPQAQALPAASRSQQFSQNISTRRLSPDSLHLPPCDALCKRSVPDSPFAANSGFVPPLPLATYRNFPAAGWSWQQDEWLRNNQMWDARSIPAQTGSLPACSAAILWPVTAPEDPYSHQRCHSLGNLSATADIPSHFQVYSTYNTSPSIGTPLQQPSASAFFADSIQVERMGAQYACLESPYFQPSVGEDSHPFNFYSAHAHCSNDGMFRDIERLSTSETLDKSVLCSSPLRGIQIGGDELW